MIVSLLSSHGPQLLLPSLCMNQTPACSRRPLTAVHVVRPYITRLNRDGPLPPSRAAFDREKNTDLIVLTLQD
jgi:hypothetical protein